MPIVDVGRIIGNKPENNEPIIKTPRQTGVDIYNENGEKVGNVPYGKNGIIGAGETVYQGKDSEGNVTYSTDPYRLTSYISFDENTGKITMHAPQEFFDSEVYSKYFRDDVITGLSRLYSQNKDAKVEMADGTQKTVKELIDAWNEDLPKLVNLQQDYTRMGKKVAERLGDEAAKKYNLGTYQIMNTSAYTGKDDDYIALPKTIINNPNWSFFKDIEGYDGENLVISKGDFVKGYYHLDASRDIASDSKTSISKLKKDVASALANYEGDDVDEFARLVAFNNFLNDQTQDGASNEADGAFYDKLVIGGAAISETFARNTAKWATEFVNFVSRVFLAPFSAVDLIATGKWNSKNIVDEVVNTAGDIIGDDLTPNAESVAEFLQNEESRRGDVFALTNSTMGLIYNLAGAATYITENVLGTIALNRLVINGATLAISGISVKKSVPTIVKNLNKLNLTDQYGNVIRTNREYVLDAANNMMTDSGVPQAVSDLLTGSSKLTTWQKFNLIGSLNPSDVLAGAAQWNNFVGKAGLMLKTGALDNMMNFSRWYTTSLQSAGSSWRTALELEMKYNQYRETLGSIYVAGRELWLTSAKMVTTLERFAKYVPTAYYAANVIIGTAIAEADTFRMLMDGVDSDEERSQLWSMVGRTALGWTIGMVVGSIVNKVFNGAFDAAAEYANAGATEKIAKGVNIVAGRINQVKELTAGKGWVDNIKNPIKKAVVKYNQSLQKSQEYLAKAADAVRAAGGTEAEARAATISAIEQMRENQNKIDFAQNPNYLVDAWNSEANPAYLAATIDATGLEAQSSRMLSDLGLADNVETTALIGGVSANGTDPQDVVNYKVRTLQRMSAFRDDYDYSSALVDFNNNLTSADITAMYVLKSPSFIRERELAKKYMAAFEEKYPKVYTDFIKNKWAPAMFQMSYQFRQIELENGYYLKSREEGWKATGMFGKNNELWFPVQRITDAQKDFEEASRNPLEIIKRGAVKRRNYEPEHYSPGSDEMTDFVHPMITWKMYEYQRAVAIAFNDLATANFMNPYVKQVTRLDGAKVGAAKTYEDLKPTYSKNVIRAMDSFKDDLEKTGFANDLLDKQKMETKIRNAQKAVEKARATWEGIPDIDVTVNNADRSRTIDTLPEDMVDEFLNKLQVPFDGEKVDIRKWLNSQVPGFDVLEWSLLGRDHTDGLVAGGLYSDMEDNYVKAYIMNLNDLRSITKLDKNTEDMSPDAIEKIKKDINTKEGGAVIPLYFDMVSGEKRFFPQTRWGHSGDRFPDWETYFNYLASNGVTRVPVAINFSKRALAHEAGLTKFLEAIDRAIATGKKPDIDYKDVAIALREFGTRARVLKRLSDAAPREEFPLDEIEKLLDKAEEYNSQVYAQAATGEAKEDFDGLDLDSQAKAMMEIHNYFKDLDVQDITSEVQQAFSEYGEIPLYHNQNDPLGTIEANDKGRVPTTREGKLYSNRGAGDALWLAPNASYTDQYGRNKVIASIPVEYFMSDKEKWSIANKYIEVGQKLTEKAIGNIASAIKNFDSNKPVKKHTFAASAKGEIAALKAHFFPVPELPGSYWIDLGGNLYSHVYATSPGSTSQDKMVLIPENRKFPVTQSWFEANYMEDFLSEKEAKELEDAARIAVVDDGTPRIRSYRALSELSGKPIIDISNDGFADGTAFFYYKGVNADFDKKLGQQLTSQAMFQNKDPRWSGESIADAMEKYDDMSLDEMIDNITNGEGWGEDWDAALEEFANGEISSSELTEDFQERVSRVAKKYPGIAKVMEETWDNNTLKDLRDMKFKYWHPSTGYPTIDDITAGMFLDEMGETRPGALTGDVSEDQRSFYDMIAPTAENIPAYTEQDLADMRLRDLERKRKILKKELKKRCD